MNGFDLIVLAILTVFAILGAWRGLLREAASMLTWVVSIVLAWAYAAPVSRWFAGWTEDVAVRQVLAFVAIFLAVFVLGLALTWIVRKYFPMKRGLRLVNTALGGALGAARGGVIVIAFFLVAGLTNLPQRGWWREAAVAPYFERVAIYVAGYIPRDIARHIRYG